MSESSWESLKESELATHFGDVDVDNRAVLGLEVHINNALPYGYALVYVDWATAQVFPYA
jgi:hypothetical protein